MQRIPLNWGWSQTGFGLNPGSAITGKLINFPKLQLPLCRLEIICLSWIVMKIKWSNLGQCSTWDNSCSANGGWTLTIWKPGSVGQGLRVEGEEGSGRALHQLTAFLEPGSQPHQASCRIRGLWSHVGPHCLPVPIRHTAAAFKLSCHLRCRIRPVDHDFTTVSTPLEPLLLPCTELGGCGSQLSMTATSSHPSKLLPHWRALVQLPWASTHPQTARHCYHLDRFGNKYPSTPIQTYRIKISEDGSGGSI